MRSDSLKKAQKKYYEKTKHTQAHKERIKKYQIKMKERYRTDEEYRKKKQEYQKKYYIKKKEKNKISINNNNEVS